MRSAIEPGPTLADALVQALARHGVRRMFGIPGGGSSLDVIEAGAGVGIDFVLARTETAAAIMAASTAEIGGAPGVVLTGIGPGAASAANGIAYARLDRAPVLIVTDTYDDGAAAYVSHQAFDQRALFRPIAKAYRRLRPGDGEPEIERLLARALADPPGPVHIELSAQDAAAPAGRAGRPRTRPARALDASALAAALQLLGRAARPVVLAGLAARGAPGCLRALVQALGCPVLTTYKAKGTIADTHPALIGHMTGGSAEAACIGQADLILLYGLDPVELIAQPWRYDAPVLALDTVAGVEHYSAPRVSLVGPLDVAAGALLETARPTAWRAAEIAALKDGMRTRLKEAGDGPGLVPWRVVDAVRAAAPAGCRITVDAGAHMFSAMALWQAVAAHDVLISNGLSTMGFAVPAAVAAALHAPDRPVVAFTGDGGLMMCLGELATAAERNCRIIVVVLNDAALSLIAVKQRARQMPSRGVRYPATDFAALARGMGCLGFSVATAAALAPTLVQAFQAPGPALVDVTIDPSGYPAQLAALRG